MPIPDDLPTVEAVMTDIYRRLGIFDMFRSGSNEERFADYQESAESISICFSGDYLTDRDVHEFAGRVTSFVEHLSLFKRHLRTQCQERGVRYREEVVEYFLEELLVGHLGQALTNYHALLQQPTQSA